MQAVRTMLRDAGKECLSELFAEVEETRFIYCFLGRTASFNVLIRLCGIHPRSSLPKK
jgi:hypothetical protein